MKIVKINQIKKNPENPRLIRDDNFRKLVQSLKDFPEMMKIRPVVCNKEMMILGGNMRYEAAKAAGWKEIPVEIVDLPADKEREFIIKDNVSGGEWDYDILANSWDAPELEEWGVDIPEDSLARTIETHDLLPFNSCHLLISYKPEFHEDVMSAIASLRFIDDIEIETSAN